MVSRQDHAIDQIRAHGGIVRTAKALAMGIHPRTLYALRDNGVLTQLSRGLYRLADLPPLTYPDLTTVALTVPRGVICAVSALAFHELTTQIPHAVDIAVCKGDRAPKLAHPPLRAPYFSPASWAHGVETHTLDGVSLRVYAPAKAVADAFKLRGRLGIDVALEALRLYRRHRAWDPGALVGAARVCRVERVMRLYVEAVLS